MKGLVGTGVALVTPFKEDLGVDIEGLQKLVEHVIEGGVEYLVVLGTTAESATLTKEEKELVKKTVVASNRGRVPLVLGLGGNNTMELVQELQEGNFDGFQALLSVSPYYNKPTQEGIYQHFKKIAQNSPLPILLYNVPGRTASNIAPETVVRLAKECSNIIGIKEAAGDLVQGMELIRTLPDDFLVISGDDIIALPLTLAGGSGVISVMGQGVPKQFSEMIRNGLNGEVSKAYQMHYQLMKLIDLIFEQGNPAGIKEVLRLAEVCSTELRLPLVNVDRDLKERITKEYRILTD